MREFKTPQRPTASPGLASGREDSYVDALYREHAPAIFAFLSQHTAARADAEDLLLEVFTAALEQPSREHFDEARRVAWLWRVARNKVVDHHRRAARRPTLNLDRV